MFTGIIEETGILLSVKGGSSGSRLVIGADRILEDIKRGDSIAVNGVCLTAASFDSGCFLADVMPETLKPVSYTHLEAKGNHVTEVEGGYRRIVASPHPVAIVEIDAIKALMDADQIVIACGGGGIPVMEQGYNLRGASAIIEKDLATGLLAKEIDADVMKMCIRDRCYGFIYLPWFCYLEKTVTRHYHVMHLSLIHI